MLQGNVSYLEKWAELRGEGSSQGSSSLVQRGTTKGNPKQFQPPFRLGYSNDGPTPQLSLEKEGTRKKAEAQREASPVQRHICSPRCRGAMRLPGATHTLSRPASETAMPFELFIVSASFALCITASEFCHWKELAVAFKIVIFL